MKESEAIERIRDHFEVHHHDNRPHPLLDEAVEMAIKALKKQIPQKPIHKYIKYGKHKWRRDENGKIDDWAWEYEFCNGVVCERCGKSVCVHCNPDYDKLKDCKRNTYNCPSCYKEVYYKQKHCDCGQKLDWRVNDENTD